MPSSSHKHVLVVGAGPVGLVLAIELARRGHRVSVVERRPDMRRKDVERGRSINLALSDRGLKALAHVGAEKVVMKDALPMRGRQIHDVKGSESFQPYASDDRAIFSVSRGGLNKTLLELAVAEPNVSVAFERRCLDVDMRAPAARFETAAGEIVNVSADVIFGADGAGSAVRGAMLPTERFAYAIDWLEHGYKELTIPAGPNGSFLLDDGALHIWPRTNYMLIALPNTDGSFTCTLFLPFEPTQPGVPSFQELGTVDEARAFFARDFGDALAKMPTFDHDFFANPTSPLGIVRCAPWQREGKVCLIGDAAHAIVPFYGQGLNAGFEDVTVFTRILDDEGGDFSRALPRFSRERKEDGDAIAELALYNFVEMRDRVGDPRFVLQKKIEAKIARVYGARYTPLYSMVTFSHRPYREALAYGRAQEALMREILALDDVAARFDDEAFWPRIAAKVDAFLAGRA